MTPERWEQVKEVLQEALAQPPAERAALLAQVGLDDADLICEVESLPAAHDDANCQSLDARLALLRTVCGAVHHAHQHLVVHRDLKPSHILDAGPHGW
jgi:hypothetical protein